MRMVVSFFLAVLMVLGGVAYAQDTPPTFCGDLSDADCALLTDAAQTMMGLESAIFHLDMNLAVSCIPDAPFDSVAFQVNGDGAFSMDSAALRALQMSPGALAENIDQLPEMIENALRAVNADVTLVFQIPPELADSRGTTLPDSVSLSLRMVNGYAYVNLDKLAELDTSHSLPRGWQGIDLAGFYRRALEQQMPMMEQMFGGASSYVGMFTDPEFLGRFVSIERLEDDEIGGQRMAVFETSIDYDALFSDATMQDYLRSVLESALATSGGRRSNDDMVDQILSFYEQMFNGLVLHVQQTIGVNDRYIHRVTAHMDWTPDLSAMGSMFGGPRRQRMPEINIVFDMQIDLTRFNDAPEITEPENATVYPLDFIFPSPSTNRG